MQQEDLQQIKKIIDSSLDKKLGIVKNDLNDSLDKKLGIVKNDLNDSLDKKLGIVTNDLNDSLDKKLDEKLEKFKDEIVTTTKEQFDEHTKQLEKIKVELAKRPTRDDFENWRAKKVEPLERDVDKLKYLHKDEWKNLPDGGTVSRVLVEKGLKK